MSTGRGRSEVALHRHRPGRHRLGEARALVRQRRDRIGTAGHDRVGAVGAPALDDEAAVGHLGMEPVVAESELVPGAQVAARLRVEHCPEGEDQRVRAQRRRAPER